ncbi:MAG TPA: ribosome biogenesis GTPase Der [Acidobacteriaceae bacterium]|nr:ribosome biogenesis GTPase Der [Acidobacteriaceae bacterium]
MAPKRDQKKRLGKKHRQASTRPKLGKSAPRGTAVTGAVSPKKRKEIAAKKAAAAKAKLTPTRSPDNERRKVIGDAAEPGAAPRKADRYKGDDDSRRKGSHIVGGPQYRGVEGEDAAERAGWREAAILAEQLTLATTGASSEVAAMALVAICGRPNVGKSTLFNRLTGTRRSIVGDEPGITRDRIYGEVEWNGRTVRLVDTGGVVPDDEALIPAEIFRQARVALEEADATVMVVDGRSELAAPDLELAKLLMRGGKPVFLAVNKIDAPELLAAAENFRRLGFRNVVPVSAEHGSGIGDLLDEVWAVLPEEGHTQEDLRAEFIQRESIDLIEGLEEEELEDMGGGGDALAPPPEPLDEDAEPTKERRLRSHGEHVLRETKVAIIGRPNVGKSTLLNALTGEDRAIVSPIAGTTRDAVDEVVERDGHSFRFIDTAGIRRKGKTKLLAEKLSVIMSRKHLEAADVALLVIDAGEGIAAADANIGGYAHESGRSVIIVVNKWDLMTKVGPDGMRLFDGKPPADQKIYEQQIRDALKYLDYAPLVFVTASEDKGMDALFKKVELVSRERRKRVTTGQMNRFLDKIDFQRASVPMNKRVRIYYMTQAAVAPPTFVLFTDRDVKLHFSYERFLANEIRDSFKFIGSPIWFKVKARNKKKKE